GSRNAADRVRHPLGDVGGAVDRVQRDVEAGRAGLPVADAFALEQTGGVVLDALADNNLTAHVHQIEHAADGVARRGIGGFLVALADPLHAVERRDLRRAEKIELKQALNVERHEMLPEEGQMARKLPEKEEGPLPERIQSLGNILWRCSMGAILLL